MALAADRPVKTPRQIGRYALFDEIASGGMATVYFGRLLGPAGFARTVAVKQLHDGYAKDPEFVSQFLDEARLAARIHHPNVVPTLDVVAKNDELFLVMEYVQGESLARLMRGASQVPGPIAVGIMCHALLGLHAAHEARSEGGEPLNIVHRDLSPHNVMVGVDGVARVLDFGVAKAASRLHTTSAGQIKGKIAYMSPEQLRDRELDRRSDVFACGIVLWEALSGKRLFARSDTGATVAAVLTAPVPLLNELDAQVPAAVARVVARALERDPEARFSTALEMAEALEMALPPASTLRVGAWVRQVAEKSLITRAQLLRTIEDNSSVQRLPSTSDLPVAGQSSLSPQVPPLSSRELGETRRYGLPVAAASSESSARSVSTSSGVTPPRPARDRKPLITAVVGLLLAASALTWALSRGGAGNSALDNDAGRPPPLAGAATSHGRAPAAAASEPVIVRPEPTTASGVPVNQLPVESAGSSDAKSRSSLTPHKKATARTSEPREKPSKPSMGANCDPPFILDASGRKRFKQECFN